VHAEILELDAGASYQILDRAGDEYVCAPEVRDPRCNVHSDATYVVRLQLDLAGVEAAPHCDGEWPHRLGDRPSAAHRAGWSVKGRQKPVAKIFDLLSAKADELVTHRFVVPVEQNTPLGVAQFGGASGRLDNVGEHHRRQGEVDLGFAARSGQEVFDLSDDTVDDVGLEQRDMIVPWQFNVPARGMARARSRPHWTGSKVSSARCRTNVGTRIASGSERTGAVEHRLLSRRRRPLRSRLVPGFVSPGRGLE
jgi:hypothetical protein